MTEGPGSLGEGLSGCCKSDHLPLWSVESRISRETNENVVTRCRISREKNSQHSTQAWLVQKQEPTKVQVGVVTVHGARGRESQLATLADRLKPVFPGAGTEAPWEGAKCENSRKKILAATRIELDECRVRNHARYGFAARGPHL